MLLGNTVGSLTSAQHAILVGSLLGDGTLRKQGTRTNALFEVNHALEFKEYVDWKWKEFQEFVLTPPKARQGNGNRVAYRFTTQSLPIFTVYYQWFHKDRKKQIPYDTAIDQRSLAVWFMDDGSKSRKMLYLNTQQFSLEEQQFLQTLLQSTFEIKSTINRDKQYYRLLISTEGTKKMKGIITPYIVPCFQYKLM